MTYYEDLSPYSYLNSHESAYNVGWLDAHHDYPICDPTPLLVRHLAIACKSPVSMTRGFHICELCKIPSRDEIMAGRRLIVNIKDVGDIGVDNGEIRVRGQSGLIYAAPRMILHYLVAHHYCPPNDFVAGLSD